MKECVFCNFEDKGAVVYEDAVCFAAVSRNPINKHHVLVIPKQHYKDFVDLPDELASHLFLTTKKLSAAVRATCKPFAIHHISDDDIESKGYNLVSHYKLHIIPRFENDGVKIEWHREDLNLETRSKIALDIKSHL
jgi:histidine triad (HIT) family protein